MSDNDYHDYEVTLDYAVLRPSYKGLKCTIPLHHKLSERFLILIHNRKFLFGERIQQVV